MATIHDIANLAGCSARTVSRVFNDSGPVKNSTRERVLQIAKDMKFQPNIRARGLRTGRNNTIGVIQSSADSEVNRARIDTMTRLFSLADYSLLINRARSFDHELELLDKMKPHCDAIVIFSAMEISAHNHYDTLMEQSYPFMLVDPVVDTNYPSVMINRENGFHDAVLELASRGRKKIALVLQGFRQEPRLRGYRSGLKLAGLQRELVFNSQPSFEGGKAVGVEIINNLSDLDALVCHNDRIALGILHTLSKANIKVPKQVAIMGFDNDRYSAYTNPSLSTIEQGTETIGVYLYEQIHGFLNKGISLQTYNFSTSLVIRDSI